VIGAVGQVHRHIDDRKAERAGFQVVANAGLDRLDVGLGHDPACDRVCELEAGTARQRLDLQHHVAELAVAARLLLVAAALLRRLADRLAIGNGRRPAFDRDLVLAFEALHGDAQVHFAVARNHRLAGILLVAQAERRVLVRQPMDRRRHLDLVLALLGAEREGIDGLGRLQADELRRAALGRAQRLAGARIFELAQRHRVAGFRDGQLGLVLAEHTVDARNLRHGAIRQDQLRTVGDAA
jgi:hypothetical protein